MGLVYLIQGRTLDAVNTLTMPWRPVKKILGTKSAAYVANLNSQAKLFQLTGKYNEAEKMFDEAENLGQQVFGANTMQMAIINNKAMLYQTMGRYKEAVELMKKPSPLQRQLPKRHCRGRSRLTTVGFNQPRAAVPI